MRMRIFAPTLILHDANANTLFCIRIRTMYSNINVIANIRIRIRETLVLSQASWML